MTAVKKYFGDAVDGGFSSNIFSAAASNDGDGDDAGDDDDDLYGEAEDDDADLYGDISEAPSVLDLLGRQKSTSAEIDEKY